MLDPQVRLAGDQADIGWNHVTLGDSHQTRDLRKIWLLNEKETCPHRSCGVTPHHQLPPGGGDQPEAGSPPVTVTTTTVETVLLPEGYPQIVPLSEVPENMQWSLEGAGAAEAVAVAPGVWAELAPGATAEDAVNAKVFNGYCASKKALEQEYLNGEATAGNCW